MIVEGWARTSTFKQIIAPPSYGFHDTAFDIQATLLDEMQAREGKIDCIFVGSSTLEPSILPVLFTQGYSAHTNQPVLNCFNFGRYGMRNQAGYELLYFLVERYQPRYIFYGITPHAFEQNRSPADQQYLESKWISYRHGKFNLEGLLTEYSHAYRTYLRYQNWMSSNFLVNLERINQQQQNYTPDGYRSLPLNSLDVRYPPFAELPANERKQALYKQSDTREKNLADFDLTKDALDELDLILSLNTFQDTQLILLEMPIHPSFMAYFTNGQVQYEAYMDEVRQHAEKHQVPYWQISASLIIPNEFWIDRHHLSMGGGYWVSYWLGAQFATAMANDFAGESAYIPPLSEVEIPPLENLLSTPLGLPEEEVEAYLAYQPSLPDGYSNQAILNPNPNAQNPFWLQLNIGSFHQALNLSTQAKQADYDDIFLFDHVQVPADLTSDQMSHLTQWYASADSKLLQEIGFDYVIYSAYWLSTLQPEMRQLLTDSTNYTLIAELSSFAYGATFYVYQINNQ